MKSTSHFKMHPSYKVLIASIGNKDARDAFRQNMIQAQLQSEIKPEPPKKTK